MTQSFSSPQVVCRPALACDRADVNEFCKGIWGGHDYVPEVWNHWFKDRNGLLAVAEYRGHAIGCAKISLISEGQWWLEGFRVDPNYQGLKVGSHIHNYVTDWWLENGDGTVRLMTNAKNIAVHHLCKKTGYVKTYEVCGYVANPIDEVTDSFSPVTDLQQAAAFALASESLTLTGHLTDLGWRIAMPDVNVFERYSSDKADFRHTFLWWNDKRGLVSVWEDEEDGQRILVVGVVACSLDDMSALLMEVRRLAAHKGFDSIFQIAFVTPQIIPQVKKAGFTKDWENNAFLFEKNK